jgi:hypothetical protein
MDESKSKMGEEISRIDEGMSQKDEPISKSKPKGSEFAQSWHQRLGQQARFSYLTKDYRTISRSALAVVEGKCIFIRTAHA